MQVELKEVNVKLIAEYAKTLPFEVSATQIANDAITKHLIHELEKQKPAKKSK